MKSLLEKKNRQYVIETLSMMLIIFVGYLIFLNNSTGLNSFNNSDIHRGFQRAVSILNNVNPYLEFNPENMLEQEKVPGFFPLYFFFMALLVKLSNYSFVLFIDNLRLLVFTAYSATGVFIYLRLRDKSKLLALFCSILYMFNRWTLNDVLDLKQDSYVILLVLLSLSFIRKNNYVAFLLYGIATALKHISILIFPLYLLEVAHLFTNEKLILDRTELSSLIEKFKKALILILFLMLPIIVPSIPFLVQTPKNFLFSLMYNVTRTPEASGLSQNTGFDKLLVLYNQDKNNTPIFYMIPRLPMVISLVILTLLLFFKGLPIWIYCAFTYLIFIGFNPVLYSQYYTWMMVFVPLALGDFISKEKIKN